MASIRPYRTPNGQRRYEVRYRDGDGRQRSRAFTAHKDAQAFKLDVDRPDRHPDHASPRRATRST
jgi:hypothetical protein